MALKKNLVLFFLVCILSGCATYKFQKPDASATQGFLAYYNGKPIAEYTVGKDKSLPDLTLAKERFKRRRLAVERYYKQTGQIQSRLKGFFWEPPAMFAGFIGGVLRWPFIAVADYKYNHNPGYKARVDRQDEEKEALETARESSLKQELDAYIAKDLAEESAGQEVIKEGPSEFEPKPLVLPPQIQEPPVQDVPEPEVIKEEPAQLSAEIKASAGKEELPPAQKALEPPVAVITAKPLKGYSPLKVIFSASKSLSRSGRIVAYSWDFGDGDTSTNKNPENTYWSTTFGSRYYTVTLSVRDQAGSTSSVTSTIEVITR
jgi:hypothetical protein